MQYEVTSTISLVDKQLDPCKVKNHTKPSQTTQRFSLSDCLSCLGRSFCVELDSSEKTIAIACCDCGNSTELAIKNLVSFSVSRWNNVYERDLMYTRLRPLYERWNKQNHPAIFSNQKLSGNNL